MIETVKKVLVAIVEVLLEDDSYRTIKNDKTDVTYSKAHRTRSRKAYNTRGYSAHYVSKEVYDQVCKLNGMKRR